MQNLAFNESAIEVLVRTDFESGPSRLLHKRPPVTRCLLQKNLASISWRAYVTVIVLIQQKLATEPFTLKPNSEVYCVSLQVVNIL